MRSTNKRSRSKPNRPKTLGNIVNRVFDSSGPEGKVRGTPQQIIEKYQVLARDAQLSNDRVAAENFQQHAEHYTRLLAQAQREMQAEQDARRQSQENHNRQGQDAQDRGADRAQDRGQDNRSQENRGQDYRGQDNRQQDRNPRQDNRRTEPRRNGDDAHYGNGGARDIGSQEAFSVQDMDTGTDADRLVETPESRTYEPATAQPAPAPQPKAASEQPSAPAPKAENRRKPRVPKPASQPVAEEQGKPAAAEQVSSSGGETATDAKPKTRRAPRKPRESGSGGSPEVETSSSAAE